MCHRTRNTHFTFLCPFPSAQQSFLKIFAVLQTPHLEGSHTVDDDAIVSMQQLGAALKSKDARQIVVQEKVDGANVSVHFEEEWNPIIQKRSDIIATGEKEQYNVFRDWVYNRLEALFEVLNTRYCLFGEWLWALHSISYDQLPGIVSYPEAELE
jgi:hypothetical protein